MGNDATQNHDDKTQNRNDATQSESNNFQGDAQDRWASFFGPDDTCHVPDDAEVRPRLQSTDIRKPKP